MKFIPKEFWDELNSLWSYFTIKINFMEQIELTSKIARIKLQKFQSVLKTSVSKMKKKKEKL